MSITRIISRLDLKNNNVVKGFHLEGWRPVGDPLDLAKNYYKNNVDEIIYLDSVASLFSRDKILSVLRKSCQDIFVPIGIGGGIRSIDDARQILENGADKLLINTYFVKNPKAISEFVSTFGSQSILLSIQSKKIKDEWYVFTESGRENSGKKVIDWIKQADKSGVGEILVTSIDNDGLGEGFDVDIIEKIKNITNLPFVIGGGFGKLEHLIEINNYNLSGISIAKQFHNKKYKPSDLKKFLKNLSYE